MDEFCGNCGHKLDKTGKCPVCDVDKSKKKNNSDKKNNKNGKKKIITVVVITLITLLLVSIGAVVLYFSYFKEDAPTGNVPEDAINADLFFNENAKVKKKMSVKSSKDVTTGKETFEIITDRGFSYYPITVEYNMDGEMIEEVIIDNETSEKYPVYTTYYTSENSEEMWVINVINGAVTAYPVFYNQNSTSEVETIIVETKTLMSYDNYENSFYQIEPYESYAIIKLVDKIDSETLDMLTAKEIDKL